MIRFLKRFFLILGVVFLLLVVVYFDMLSYGIKQGIGQFTIIHNAKPIETYLEDPEFPDSLKQKLRFIEKVRIYAIDSLGLYDSDNYKTLYDQKGEEIMWVVTASEAFRLKPKEWSFPILGNVPYKGFFDKEAAIALGKELKEEGYDVNIRNPGAWSTLGWFTDPILSGMLDHEEGDLASLIIHEMSHATIFVKDSVEFNENLATFIGDRGAERFLISTYGKESEVYKIFIGQDQDYIRVVDHMLRGASALDTLYHSFDDRLLDGEKLRLKNEKIAEIVTTLDTLSLSTYDNLTARFKKQLPNNAYFMSYLLYQSQQYSFNKEFEEEFGSNLITYIQYLRNRFPSL